ncbi:MAG: hypothetical protein FWD75_03950 [Propionibacteriaceae bacterium]|nr:hypothetical protein [Propionibacteriaceae bacterium]
MMVATRFLMDIIFLLVFSISAMLVQDFMKASPSLPGGRERESNAFAEDPSDSLPTWLHTITPISLLSTPLFAVFEHYGAPDPCRSSA